MIGPPPPGSPAEDVVSARIDTPKQRDDTDGEISGKLAIVELERRMATTLSDGSKLGQVEAQQLATRYSEVRREILNEIAGCPKLPYNIAACNGSGYSATFGRTELDIADYRSGTIRTHVTDFLIAADALDQCFGPRTGSGTAWRFSVQLMRCAPGTARVSSPRK